MRNALCLVVVVMAAGCTGGDGTIASGNAALGISDFRIARTAQDVTVMGVDARGEVVAQMIVGHGHVSLPSEGLDGEGRTLFVQVASKQVEHRSVGTQAITLPAVKEEHIDAFLADPHVAPLLGEAGITISSASSAQADATGERPLATCTHDTNQTCGATDCFEETGGATEYVCCGASMLFVDRSCSSGSTSACGTNGPLGCAVCWTQSYSASCSITPKGTGAEYTLDGICTCNTATCGRSGYYCEDAGGSCFCTNT